MKVAALIPARVNSRRLPDKNWQDVGGVPLWLHAVDHAIKSNVCDLVAISTNDDRIGALSMGKGVAYIQQPDFEQTYNVMLDVVRHADFELAKRGHDCGAICLLQPTSPLRLPIDVQACVNMLASGAAYDAVVSVTEAEDDIVFAMRHANRLERAPQMVKPNGAVYVIRTEVLRSGGSWYGDFTYGYTMPKDRSIDIDNALDLEMAQLAWHRLNGPGA